LLRQQGQCAAQQGVQRRGRRARCQQTAQGLRLPQRAQHRKAERLHARAQRRIDRADGRGAGSPAKDGLQDLGDRLQLPPQRNLVGKAHDRV